MPLVPVDNIGAIGVARDQYSHELPPNAWSRSVNCRFKDGYAAKFGGHGAIYGTPSVTPYFVQPLSTASGRFWIYASGTKLYSVTGTTHTDRTRSSGGDYSAVAGTWSGGVLGGIAVVNNPADIPQFWNGSAATFANLTAWDSNWRCKVMRPFKNFLVAANITKSGTAYPHMVKWSTAAVPGSVPASWNEADPTVDAGEFDLADDQSRIVDALGLGDQFIVYKEGAFYAMQYIGPPYIFRQQRLVSGQIGALSLNCAVEFPGGHAVLGQGDLVYHSGGSPTSIVDSKMRRYLFNNIDSTNYQLSFMAHNFLRGEVWCCYPTVGASSCNQALVWNYKDNTLAVRDLPDILHANSGAIDFTAATSWDAQIGDWDDATTAWNQAEFTQSAQRLVMASATNTKLYLAEYTETFDGTPMQAYVEREGLDFGDPMSVKTMTQVRPLIEAKAGTIIQIVTGGAMDLQAGTTWNAPVNFTVGTDQKIDTFATGRYLAIRIIASNSVQWRLKRYDMTYEVVSQY